jgi:hypothetical protein
MAKSIPRCHPGRGDGGISGAAALPDGLVLLFAAAAMALAASARPRRAFLRGHAADQRMGIRMALGGAGESPHGAAAEQYRW